MKNTAYDKSKTFWSWRSYLTITGKDAWYILWLDLILQSLFTVKKSCLILCFIICIYIVQHRSTILISIRAKVFSLLTHLFQVAFDKIFSVLLTVADCWLNNDSKSRGLFVFPLFQIFTFTVCMILLFFFDFHWVMC